MRSRHTIGKPHMSAETPCFFYEAYWVLCGILHVLYFIGQFLLHFYLVPYLSCLWRFCYGFSKFPWYLSFFGSPYGSPACYFRTGFQITWEELIHNMDCLVLWHSLLFCESHTYFTVRYSLSCPAYTQTCPSCPSIRMSLWCAIRHQCEQDLCGW